MSTDEKPKWIKSPEELKGAKTPTYIEKIEAHVCPTFDADKGARMEAVRMKMLMSQGELASLLGISQSIVSKLERGAVSQASFTLGRLRAVFGTYFHFILFGTGDANQWNLGHIHRKFWDTRLRVRRKPGSGLWKREQYEKGVFEYWKGRVKKGGNFGS